MCYAVSQPDPVGSKKVSAAKSSDPKSAKEARGGRRQGSQEWPEFDPEGSGYDDRTARAAGMTPHASPGPNKGHMGSVVHSTAGERARLGLPMDSYLILKGRKHRSFPEHVAGEAARGYRVIKRGGRYWSVRYGLSGGGPAELYR